MTRLFWYFAIPPLSAFPYRLQWVDHAERVLRIQRRIFVTLFYSGCVLALVDLIFLHTLLGACVCLAGVLVNVISFHLNKKAFEKVRLVRILVQYS